MEEKGLVLDTGRSLKIFLHSYIFRDENHLSSSLVVLLVFLYGF